MKKYLITGAVALLIIGGVFYFSREPNVSSVNVANEYHATTTEAMSKEHNLIKTGSSILGSIIVASTSPTALKIWNATSTTDVASTTLGSFAPEPEEGTYTFDTIMTRGIIIETLTGFNGTYIITYR